MIQHLVLSLHFFICKNDIAPLPLFCGKGAVSLSKKLRAFSQTKSLSQMEKRASPLFQAFFPLQPRFFLNQAAVFRQSHPLPLFCGKGAFHFFMAHAWQFPQGAVRHGQKSAERLGKDNSGRCFRPAVRGHGGSRRGTAAPTGKRGIPAPLSWTAQ